MDRKIVSFSTNTVPDDLWEMSSYEVVTALCNDGSLWRIEANLKDSAWSRLPDIPAPATEHTPCTWSNTMDRKIVSVSTNTVPEDRWHMSPYEVVTALCNDGSLWRIEASLKDSAWSRLPDIPQDEKD